MDSPQKAIAGVLLVLLMGSALSLASIYAYAEPRTTLGVLYLRVLYDPSVPDLNNISTHLAKVENGYLPRRFDAFLMEELAQMDPQGEDFANVVGFYARQSQRSRSGEQIYEEGRPYAPRIIELGLERAAVDSDDGAGHLILAHDIIQGRKSYKPQVHVQKHDVEAQLHFLAEGRTELVKILEP